MDFKLRPNAKYASSEELITDLKKVADLLNKKTVTAREYEKHGLFSIRPFINRFGSWNDTLKEANLKISAESNISLQMLFDNLEVVWRTLGRQPFSNEMRRPFSKYD